MTNIQKLNSFLSKFYPDLPFGKGKTEKDETKNTEQVLEDISLLNPFGEEYKSEIYAKTIDEAIQKIDGILAEIESETQDEENYQDDVDTGADSEPCCFDDEEEGEEDMPVFYAPEDEIEYDLSEPGKIVEGVLIPESEFASLINNKDELVEFLGTAFDLSEDFDIYEDLEVYTSDFYFGIPEGYVLLTVRGELLSEAVKKRKKPGGRMVLKGRIVTGAKRIRLKIYRKRYYRRKKARLRIKQRRARVRRKVRGGRVSQREYRRERSMRTAGTLRRKHQVLKPGRKGFKTLTKEEGNMEGKLLWEAISEFVPSAEEYRNIYYTILTRAIDKASLYIENNNRVRASEVLNLFEKYFNNLTSAIARDLSNKYIVEDEYTEYDLKQLEIAYNDFVDYINDLLAELRQYLAVRDFDSADEVLFDLRDSIDDFFGYLYPSDETMEDEVEDTDWDEVDVPSQETDDEEEYIIPISDSDDEDSEQPEDEDVDEKE